jgi:hypothetical protein
MKRYLNAGCLFLYFWMINSLTGRPFKSEEPKMLDRNLDFDVFDISSCISDSDRMHIMVCQSTKITSARNNTFTEGNPGSGTDLFFKSERIERFIEAQAFLQRCSDSLSNVFFFFSNMFFTCTYPGQELVTYIKHKSIFLLNFK